MTLKAEGFLIFVDSDGKRHTMSAEKPPLSRFAEVRVECDSKKCANRHGSDLPVVVEWSEEDAVKSAIPDSAHRIITLQEFPGAVAKTFCSAMCLSDYMKYEYVMPLSPREQEEQSKRNEAVEAARTVQQMDDQADGYASEHEEDRTLN